MELYAHYFPIGKKIGIGIALSNGDVFKDWAVIHAIDEDLVSLQLSRDILPVEASIHYGQILELRGGTKESAYCCRAIVVSEDDDGQLLLRFIGEIVSDELREFYRIDAFLPIKCFANPEQNIDKLHKEWEERRSCRQKENIDDKDLYEPWNATVPLAANISGGGFRIVTQQAFKVDEYVLLEILVPSPQRILDVVGRVVFANQNYYVGNDKEYFNLGIQFVYIDERDRDAIVTYISTIQLKRIRQLRERYLFREVLDSEESYLGRPKVGTIYKQIVYSVILLLFLGYTIKYFWNYIHERPKGEIERTFEEGIIKYRDELQQKYKDKLQQK